MRSTHDTVSENKSPVHLYYEGKGVTPVTVAQARKAVKLYWAANICPLLESVAGAGKTSLVHQIAKEEGWDLLHLYLAHLGSEEIRGLFAPGDDGNTYKILANSDFYSRVHKVIKGESKGLIIFLDELNRASDQDTLNAVFSMISSHAIPGLDFSQHNVKFIAAGNPPTGKYAVAEMADDAFVRRLGHIAIRIDTITWLEYAKDADYHSLVTSYIANNPTLLFVEASSNKGRPHPNPASWEKVSNVLKQIDLNSYTSWYSLQTVVAGILGGVVAEAFVEYVQAKDVFITATELLEGDWETESLVRLSKAKLDGKLSLVSNLLEATVNHIMGDRPELSSNLVGNIIQFLYWLDRDLQGRFTVLISEIVKNTEDKQVVEDYLYKLTNSLQNHPEHGHKFKKLAREVNIITRKG